MIETLFPNIFDAEKFERMYMQQYGLPGESFLSCVNRKLFSWTPSESESNIEQNCMYHTVYSCVADTEHNIEELFEINGGETMVHRVYQAVWRAIWPQCMGVTQDPIY